MLALTLFSTKLFKKTQRSRTSARKGSTPEKRRRRFFSFFQPCLLDLPDCEATWSRIHLFHSKFRDEWTPVRFLNRKICLTFSDELQQPNIRFNSEFTAFSDVTVLLSLTMFLHQVVDRILRRKFKNLEMP